jgi:hypothetical protein
MKQKAMYGNENQVAYFLCGKAKLKNQNAFVPENNFG